MEHPVTIRNAISVLKYRESRTDPTNTSPKCEDFYFSYLLMHRDHEGLREPKMFHITIECILEQIRRTGADACARLEITAGMLWKSYSFDKTFADLYMLFLHSNDNIENEENVRPCEWYGALGEATSTNVLMDASHAIWAMLEEMILMLSK